MTKGSVMTIVNTESIYGDRFVVVEETDTEGCKVKHNVKKEVFE